MDEHDDQDLHPDMSEPDWDRFGIKPPNHFEKVGDPRRWGASIVTPIQDFASINTPQILSITTRDGYSRSWSVLGTLGLPLDLWGTAIADLVFIRLEITMGVGQAQIVHLINLLGPNPATGAPGVTGLCLTQYWKNGGPYVGIPEGLSPQQRAFAIVGGLSGQSISIRALYTIGATGSPNLPSTSLLTLIANPYAAGEGL